MQCCRSNREGGQLETINGIIYKQNDSIIKTSAEKPFNFNAIPFPARELLDNDFIQPL